MQPASAVVNGPVLSAVGTACFSGTEVGSLSNSNRTTPVVNDDQPVHVWLYPCLPTRPSVPEWLNALRSGRVLERSHIHRGGHRGSRPIADRRRDLLCQLRADIPNRPDALHRGLHVAV